MLYVVVCAHIHAFYVIMTIYLWITIMLVSLMIIKLMFDLLDKTSNKKTLF